ncbi:MAG: winged helix-turn-helix domain-containing protein [Nitrososphaerota archaeon]
MNEGEKNRIIDDLELKIIKLLENKPMSAAELSLALNVSKPSIYVRINRLLSKGVIVKKRIENKVVFCLSKVPEEKHEEIKGIKIKHKIEIKNILEKTIIYSLIFIGMVIFLYTIYSAIEKSMPLRIVGGLIIAFPLWMIALWLKGKFKES